MLIELSRSLEPFFIYISMTFVVKGWPSQDNYHDLSFAEVHIIFRLEEHFYRLEKGPHCLFVFALTKLD